MAGFGAGGAIGTVALTVAGDRLRKGRLMVLAATMYGVGMALFAFSPDFYLSLVLLAIVGASGLG